MLGSCSKLDRLKLAGEKVKQTVNACAQTFDTPCPEVKTPSVSVDKEKTTGGMDTKALNTWDIHMMLW